MATNTNATTNPLISQGTLNRLRASLQIPGNTSLNVTSSFLGKRGISMRKEGETVTYIPAMTGAVTAPEPYIVVMVSVNLLRSQSLAALYKAQIELQATIGDITVIPDASTLPQYNFSNCSIEHPETIDLNGENADWELMIKGYYNINQFLWNGI